MPFRIAFNPLPASKHSYDERQAYRERVLKPMARKYWDERVRDGFPTREAAEAAIPEVIDPEDIPYVSVNEYTGLTNPW